jgi:hypothetical protein
MIDRRHGSDVIDVKSCRELTVIQTISLLESSTNRGYAAGNGNQGRKGREMDYIS